MQLNCTSTEIERHLAGMAHLLARNGSAFSDALTVRQQGNDLALLSAEPATSRAPLLAVSVPCLVPLEDFELRAEGHEIVIFAAAKAVTPLQMELMEHQLAVFNLTGKLALHRAINPAFRYSESDPLLQHLYRARAQKLEFALGLQAMAPGARDITAFFFTRTLKIDLPSRGASRVLMPLLDYCNHHPLAPPYLRMGPSGQGLGVASAPLVHGSPESFVCYGQQSDALDIYLNYHFISPDDATPFVRSVPLTVNFEGLGSLTIASGRPAAHTGPLPGQDQDLAGSVPAFGFTGPDRLRATHLRIDLHDQAPVTRRVLGLLLRALPGEISGQRLEGLVRDAERQILESNIGFYRRMLRLANDRTLATGDPDPVIAACRLVADVQLGKLARYGQRWDLC